ncbi:caspase Dronc [Drosophila pseudoobscura]|uniref:Caspase Dronc n=1 Tax=Drosophila pseudoobscura pseudoobscura TaxID=46245 RepID=Q2LZR3_DROPS|nr:caspase Dronc [Drosophila pseudoobscura]
MQHSRREIGMLQKHRDHINEHLDELVKCTNYTRIREECVRINLLSPDMLRNVEDLSGAGFNMSKEDSQLEQHRRLLIKITKRGPAAYNQLITVLRNVGSLQAVKLLEDVSEQNSGSPFISINERKITRKSADIVDTPSPAPTATADRDGACVSKREYNEAGGTLIPYTEPVDGQKRDVKKSDRVHTDEVVGTYNMQSQHYRGVLLMINIIDFPDTERKRNGAEVDSDSLIHLFREMGFTIFAYNNMNQEQFFDTLGKVTSSKYAQQTECFVMVLMTHGERVGEMDKVEFGDGSVVDVHKIKNYFQASVSPYLVHKPKVLIFPFCRGREADLGQRINHFDSIGTAASRLSRQEETVVETEGRPSIYTNVPSLSDTLVCYASTPGYVTHRDAESGSWYIQTFCDMMADHAHNTPVEDILKKTNELVGHMRTSKGSMQTGSFDNLGFNKKLYFNPGFYTE